MPDADPIFALARHVAATRYDVIPRAAREAARRSIMDTLGTALAGGGMPLGRTAADIARAWGGAPECSLLGYADRLPAPHAVFANAALARVTDLDDMDETVGEHPAIAPVMSALAAAEAGGPSEARKDDGRTLVAAVALATDTGIRIRSALRSEPGDRPWCPEVYAPFAAAAAAGRVFGFDEERMVSALGIALEQVSGTWQMHREGASVYQLQYALAAKAGFLSAWLARQGVTGPTKVILGEYGLARHYSVGGMDVERLTAGLGERYLNTQATVKVYACGGFTHRPIEGMRRLAKQHGIAWDAIERIVVRINKHGYQRVCHPIEVKRAPPSFLEAQFSAPFAVATAAVLGDVFLDEMNEKTMRDPRVLALARRVECVMDPSLDRPGLILTPVVVEVTMRGGATHRVVVERVRGHPGEPLTLVELGDKFRRCARHAQSPLPGERVERAIGMLARLEDVPDVREVTALLRSG
ncbi:MAG: MmgE/PrpD family protein [Dehalococcoidia bacterium]|nr:MmgE/PrpD family protein [Dehalococcoidia bacterium]